MLHAREIVALHLGSTPCMLCITKEIMTIQHNCAACQKDCGSTSWQFSMSYQRNHDNTTWLCCQRYLYNMCDKREHAKTMCLFQDERKAEFQIIMEEAIFWQEYCNSTQAMSLMVSMPAQFHVHQNYSHFLFFTTELSWSSLTQDSPWVGSEEGIHL